MFKPLRTLKFIWSIALGAMTLLACSSRSEENKQRFEDIQPKRTQTHKKTLAKQDTLTPYLLKYTNDSVGLNVEAIEVDARAHFLDRFPHPKGQYPIHFVLREGKKSTYVGEWKFKDSNTRINALFNWLDHYGPNAQQLEWFERQKISKENVLILINSTSILEINSAGSINRKLWERYQRYSYPSDSIRIIIEQRAGQSCRWTKPKMPKQ